MRPDFLAILSKVLRLGSGPAVEEVLNMPILRQSPASQGFSNFFMHNLLVVSSYNP